MRASLDTMSLMIKAAALCATLTVTACAPLAEGAGDLPRPDTCNASGYAPLLGTNIAAVTLPGDLLHRVIMPGMAVTMDFREDRLNIETDDKGVITRIYCG